MIAPLLKRELMLMARTPSSWMLGLVFFALFLLLCVIALGGRQSVMQPLAPALIWLAVIFSQLLAFNSVFQSDYEDGSLEQLALSGVGMLRIVLAKAAAFFIFVYLPLLFAIPIAGIGFALSPSTLAAICLSLIFAAPALIAYGVMTAAMMAGRPQSGFLSVIITAPFLVPVLIFGLAAIDNYFVSGITGLEFQALAGLSFIGCALGFPAASAALSTHLE
ncbi:MAG: heme exporter protein CcmB [Alphaproteobacteria bacterium]